MSDETARNPEDDRVIALLERTLAAHAESSSAPPDLAVRARTRRRRRAAQRTAGVGATALGVAAAIAVPMMLTGAGADPNPEPINTLAVAPAGSGLPPVEPAADGWRWETYGGVELQVPDDWGRGVSHAQWCGGEGGGAYVGRPGAVSLVACSESQDPPENKNRHVDFEPIVDGGGEPSRTEFPEGWVRESRDVGQVLVTIQLDDASLVEQIFATARVIDSTDAVGCPVSELTPASLDARPSTGALDPAELLGDGVVCQYAVGPYGPAATLIASRRMHSTEVAAFAAGTAGAPVGGGPDDPADCSDETRRGDDALLVRLATTDGIRDIYVWYSGCIHGIDDGVTLHALTVDALQPLFGGSVSPTGTSHSAGEILFGAADTAGR